MWVKAGCGKKQYARHHYTFTFQESVAEQEEVGRGKGQLGGKKVKNVKKAVSRKET